PIENLDWDFRRQNVEAGFEWNVLTQERMPDGRTSAASALRKANLTWKVDYEWEVWNRKFRDVNRNNEHSIRNRLDFDFNLSGGGKNSDGEANPITTLRLKADYTYSNRRALGYNTQPLSFNANFPGSPVGGNTTAWVVVPPSGTNPGTVFNLGVPTEFNLLRRYDQNDRRRNDGSLTLELLMGPNTNFSASYRYLGDEHDKNFYGRLYNRFSFVNTEFTHIFENGSFFYANYSRETNRFAYRDLAHLLPAPNPLVQGVFAQFPIANTWERTSRNSLDSLDLGINAAPQEGKLQNWQFDLSYALSFARDRISTLNPFTVRPDSVLHAGANPYPDTVVRRQDLNIVVTRRISERIEIGGRYWYEPYTQDDFSFNVLQPYVHGNLTSDTPKYLFQDARYASYHSNVATVFVRYAF
ncbi:MAG: MtrB/PioB family outer membrane beta-barrel protein, partial [Pyrinomonadaceae bacterium]